MPSATTRIRTASALIASLSIAATATIALPAGTLAAQGDDEAMIAVIEQAMPAVVTIRVTGGTVAGFDDDSDEQDRPEDDDREQPEDEGQGQEDDDQEQEQDDDQRLPEDLEELLPEGFELPEDFDFQDPGRFQFPAGTGSGVIIDPDGLIITNGHVVGDAEDVEVILDDGTVLDGTVTGVDTLTDFAFVTVEATDLAALPLGDSSTLRVGQRAVAIGNPLGQFPGSASIGIVSGLDRSLNVFGAGGGLRHLIQTDAAVNPGNSGGAVLDGDGSLIGITTAEAGMSDGIGFALPIDLAKPIIEQALAGETLARPYIGVLYRDIDAQLASDEALPVEDGAWIRSFDGADSPVVDGGPADEAGIEDGDIITAIDGLPVDEDNPLDLQVLRFGPGEEITLSVLRDGEELSLPATLGTRPADLAS